MRHLVSALFLVLVAAPALATTVDFTTGAWDGANGVIAIPPIATTTFAVPDIEGSGVDVTATATVGFSLITNTVNGPPPAPPTTPATANGMGIISFIDTDRTEISDNEILTITFSQPVTITSILVSKLFTIASGKDTVDEEARWSFDGGPTQMFVANTVDPEGRHFLTFTGGANISAIDFFTQGGDHDYSLVSIGFVPEPTMLALLGTAGLFAAGTRKRERERGRS